MSSRPSPASTRPRSTCRPAGCSPPWEKTDDTRSAHAQLSSAQYRILTLWFVGVLPAYGVTVIQLVNDYYGERIDEAVGWLLSATLPTLLLIVGVVGARAVQEPGGGLAEAVIDRRFALLALGVSLLYLLLLNGVVFLQPLSRVSERLGPFEMLKTANLIIGPFQGLVGGVLGALFVSGKAGSGNGDGE